LIVANITAEVARMMLMVSLPADPAAITAPTRVIPDMAFDPDMRGVCKVAGTLDIISIPKKIDKINIKARNISVVGSMYFPYLLKFFIISL
jgi:hypothetical protein